MDTTLARPAPPSPDALPDGRDLPVLVFCPGSGTGPANSADRIAEIIAATIDRHSQGTYSAAKDAAVSAPRGLVVGKSVIDDATKQPVLHVFELDYRRRMITGGTTVTPQTAPGVFRASVYALVGVALAVRALFRPAKHFRARLQVLFGLLAAAALVAAAALSVLAWLNATGVWTAPAGWLGAMLHLDDAMTAVVTSGGTVALWTAARRKLLGAALVLQRFLRYLGDPRFAATVALTVDDAVDGLADLGWTGKVHVLGYSFGSLVALDALLPPQSGLRPNRRVTEGVASLTTIGCPVDAVRLFDRTYANEKRAARLARNAPWYNVYDSRDVLSSNFDEPTDYVTSKIEKVSRTPRFIRLGGRAPAHTYRYGRRTTLGLLDILAVRGLTLHGGYWGGADEASCFDELVPNWVPHLVRPAARRRPT